jgi:tRNA-splicing ligase RtcB
MEISKISEFVWKIEPQGNMKVPALIFSSDDLIEMIKKDKTLEQIKNVTELPGIINNALCMPDAHQGYGFPIGGVAALSYENGGISPGGIGYDENCGVRLLTIPMNYKSLMEDRDKFQKLLDFIFKVVPVGVGRDAPQELRLTQIELDNVLRDGAIWAVKNGYGIPEDIDRCENNGKMDADPTKISSKAKSRGRTQLGTLGAGNHFLEIQKISEIFDNDIAKAFGLEKDNICVMIHCGSRGLGHQVCSDYLRDIEKEYPELIATLPDRELIYAPSGSRLANDFFLAMSGAANFAWANRQIIMHNVRKAFNRIYGIEIESMKLVYDVCHNIAKIEEYDTEIDGKIIRSKYYVHRKGATRAFPKGHPEIPEIYRNYGQPVIIPGSMGTASYVLVGTENAMKLTFGSTAHGAGRTMSRHSAKELSAEKITKELESKGITVKSASINGIVEESPDCYKDIDEVIKITVGAKIANKVARFIPIAVIKG